MKKLTFFSFLFISFSASISVSAQKTVIDRVIANIGSEIVLLSELEEQYALLEAQKGVLPTDIRCGILDQIMAQKLLVNQAKLDSVEVSDVEVEVQLDQRIEQILAYMNGDEKAFEDYYGQTVPEVKDAFREDLKSQLLADRMRGQVVSGTTVTPSEVRAFFDRIPIDSLPYFNSEVEIGEVVRKPTINEEQKKIAIDKLTEIKELIDAGGDFAELAQKHSDDFGSARIGGDLGWTSRGKFVPEFEAEAYKLDPMEISPIFESQFGFHILQLLERRGNSIHTRHVLVKPKITDEDIEKTISKLDSIRTSIVEDSLSFSFAVKLFSDKDLPSYNNDGRMQNPKTGNTFFEIADLEPDVYFTVDTIDIGGVSNPFIYTDPRGDSYYRIVQLQSRTMPHKANLGTDYSKIREATKQEKQARTVNDWVIDKINSTFIRIHESYLTCPNMQGWTDQAMRP